LKLFADTIHKYTYTEHGNDSEEESKRHQFPSSSIYQSEEFEKFTSVMAGIVYGSVGSGLADEVTHKQVITSTKNSIVRFIRYLSPGIAGKNFFLTYELIAYWSLDAITYY
jgi:hypothetical protein